MKNQLEDIDYFSDYVNERIYKSLMRSEFYLTDNIDDTKVEQAFQNALVDFSTIKEVKKVLGSIFNDTGLKVFSRRYTKFKSGRKLRSKKVTISISTDIAERLNKIANKLNYREHDEVLDHLMDRTDESIWQICMAIEGVTTFEKVYNALPHTCSEEVKRKLLEVTELAYLTGVKSVPIDMRKKRTVERETTRELEQFISALLHSLQ